MRAIIASARLPHRLFLCLAPFLYAAYALITPPFQAFDENQHLYRAWQLASFQLIGEKRGAQAGGELPPGLARATQSEIGSLVPLGPRIAVVRPASAMFARKTPIGLHEQPGFLNFSGAVLYSPVGYGPQIVAVWLGRGLDLPVEWIIRLGRLLNAALAIALIALALRILPVGKKVMLTTALLPPAAAGAAAFGQDGLVIGCAFLLTAVGTKVAIERRWRSKDLAIAAAAGIAITVAKLVYLPLLAVAAFPLPGRAAPHRWLAPPLLLGLAAALSALMWVHMTQGLTVKFISNLPDLGSQLAWLGAHPGRFLGMVLRTYCRPDLSFATGLFSFGDSTVPYVISAAPFGMGALLLSMAFGEKEAGALTLAGRAWMLILVMAVGLLIATILFLSYSWPDSLFIQGIQSRYFVPVLPLALIALIRPHPEPAPRLLPILILLATASNAAALHGIFGTFYRL